MAAFEGDDKGEGTTSGGGRRGEGEEEDGTGTEEDMAGDYGHCKYTIS